MNKNSKRQIAFIVNLLSSTQMALAQTILPGNGQPGPAITAPISHEYVTGYSGGGVPLTQTQPSFSDLLGTLGAAQCVIATNSTAGCAFFGGGLSISSGSVSLATVNPVSHEWINSVSSLGIPSLSQPSCSDLSNGSVYCSAALGQLPGTATNDNASAGNLSEYMTNSGATVSMTSGSAQALAQIILTPGDWDVWGDGEFIPAGSTTPSVMGVAINIGSTSLPSVPDISAHYLTMPFSTGAAQDLPTGAKRVSVASNSTVFLVGQTNFSVSTMTATGIIAARRRR
jgi:hypothetical protein